MLVWIGWHARWLLGISMILAAALAVVAAVVFAYKLEGMVWVQMQRRMQLLRFYATSLLQKPVTLHAYQAGLAATYSACGFTRQLAPAEVMQLALRAGFSPAAATTLARSLPAAAGSSHDAAGCSRQQTPHFLPTVAIPAWRYKYFMWWLSSHLKTLQLVSDEWEQQSPQLICGFDVTRAAAEAMLFRRPKGTCLVRLGMEVGGIIVSLRPDKASLPATERTPESYFNSVSAAELAGGAYELAQQHWMPERRAVREGAVVHVFIPDASLGLHGTLWGCLHRMRHTKTFLDASTGEALPSSAAFKQPQPKPTPRQLNAWRRQLLAEQDLLAEQLPPQQQQQQQQQAPTATGQRRESVRQRAAQQQAEEMQQQRSQQQLELRQLLLRITPQPAGNPRASLGAGGGGELGAGEGPGPSVKHHCL